MTPAAPQNSPRRRFTVQASTYARGLTAMKMASECETLDELRPNLMEALPYNSTETRGGYCSSLIAWAFAEGGLNPIGAKARRACGDESLGGVDIRIVWKILAPKSPIPSLAKACSWKTSPNRER